MRFQSLNSRREEGSGNHNIVNWFPFATFAVLLSEDAVSVTVSLRIQFEAHYQNEVLSNASDSLQVTFSFKMSYSFGRSDCFHLLRPSIVKDFSRLVPATFVVQRDERQHQNVFVCFSREMVDQVKEPAGTRKVASS